MLERALRIKAAHFGPGHAEVKILEQVLRVFGGARAELAVRDDEMPDGAVTLELEGGRGSQKRAAADPGDGAPLQKKNKQALADVASQHV